jgi:hypothetical protein
LLDGTPESGHHRVVGMFDYYEPVPVLACPHCGAPIEVWQGKDGPNVLFVWRQTEPHPVDHPVVEESRIAPSSYADYRLPDVFGIMGWCVNGDQIEAAGTCEDGVWQRVSELRLPSSN